MTKADKDINFNDNAIKIHNKVRAMCKINTNHFIYNNKIIKVLKTEAKENNDYIPAGNVISVNKEGILIKCKTGAILIITVKPEGKNIMSAYDWSLGSKIKSGDKILCKQEE